MKVLLIESETAFAEQLARALEARGLEARTTGDGKEALELARVDRPDVIVLCVELPRMSGYSVCNKLKKDDELKDIPLVVMSAEATPETFEQHRKLKTRAEGYLIKPFAPGALVEILGTLVQLPPEPAVVSSDDLVTLDGEELAGGHPASEAELPVAAGPGEDEDLKLLDEAFESLSTDVSSPAETEPGVELTAAPGDTAQGAEIDQLGERADAALAALHEEEPADTDFAAAAALFDGGAAPHAAAPEPAHAPRPEVRSQTAEDTAALAARHEAERADLLARLASVEAALQAERESHRVVQDQARKSAEQHAFSEVEMRAATDRAQAAEALTRAAEAQARIAGERAQREAEQRRVAEAAAAAAGERAQAAEARAQAAEARIQTAEAKAQAAEGRAQAAEGRAQAAEGKAQAAEGKAQAAETRAQAAEGKGQAAQQQAEGAEQRAHASEQVARAAEERAREAERQAGAAAEQARQAEGRAAAAEQELTALRARLEESERSASDRAAEARQAGEHAEALRQELEAEKARASGHERDLATLRPELETARAELSSARAAADGARAEAERAATELRQRIADLEALVAKHEERVVKAYQKIKGDEKLREKTRKALAIALQLLEERPVAAQPGASEVQPRRE